jgi:phosphatidylglycerophosphatase A
MEKTCTSNNGRQKNMLRRTILSSRDLGKTFRSLKNQVKVKTFFEYRDFPNSMQFKKFQVQFVTLTLCSLWQQSQNSNKLVMVDN